VFHLEEIRDDGLYTGKCPQGHDLLVATQTLRHEMLFEIALNAILDGYRREAISSFAAAVERFFEFAIGVLARNRGVTEPIFTSSWKEVAAQSERQIGAFIFLYTITFREVPRLLSNPMVALRNNVVHRGMLPDQKQVTAFGAAAYDVIQSGIQKLRATCLEDVNAALKEHVTEIAKKMGSVYPRSFQVTPTALNVIQDMSQGYSPFSDVLSRYRITTR
jgi:hypothetical protein